MLLGKILKWVTQISGNAGRSFANAMFWFWLAHHLNPPLQSNYMYIELSINFYLFRSRHTVQYMYTGKTNFCSKEHKEVEGETISNKDTIILSCTFWQENQSRKQEEYILPLWFYSSSHSVWTSLNLCSCNILHHWIACLLLLAVMNALGPVCHNPASHACCFLSWRRKHLTWPMVFTSSFKAFSSWTRESV